MNKAWITVALAVLIVLNTVWGGDLWSEWSEKLVNVVLAILVPIAVYAVPDQF